MKLVVAVLMAGLLGGCTLSGPQLRADDDYRVMPPPGTRIELHRPLSVPGGHTRVFLQRGEVVSKQGFDRYRPSCNFEIRTLAEQPRQILPEDFLVSRAQRETAEVVFHRAAPLMLAGLNFVGMDDGLPMVVHSVHLWISSDRQPDVMRLTCRGAFGDPPNADPPSIAQMKQALGSYASLKSPSD
ncbi:MAG: hypothetical protein QNJ78_10935 [Gammaproteobacteria bacterium]|nr:hypothetical protein [Gammaproteobacteria bacterium]